MWGRHVARRGDVNCPLVRLGGPLRRSNKHWVCGINSTDIIMCAWWDRISAGEVQSLQWWGRFLGIIIGWDPGVCQVQPVTRVRETFELNQLKSAPSQLLPVFSGFHRLQTCCDQFGPADILYFFSSAGLFLLHCSKTMKCNNEAKPSLVRHSPNCYKPTTDT
jgi:hypothetical protein